MQYDPSPLMRIFDALPEDAVSQAAEVIRAHGRIFVCGAGRSGLMMKAFAMRLAQMGRTVWAAGESVTPAIARGDLLIAASASGATAGVLHDAAVARDAGADVFAITASPDAPLASLCGGMLCLPAPTKDSAAPDSLMGTLFEQALLLVCDGIAAALCDDPAAMRTRHANLE